MNADRLNEYMDLMRYEIGYEINDEIKTDCYTNSLVEAEKYFYSLVAKYTKSTIEDHVIVFIYDNNSAKRIKDYDNTIDVS